MTSGESDGPGGRKRQRRKRPAGTAFNKMIDFWLEALVGEELLPPCPGRSSTHMAAMRRKRLTKLRREKLARRREAVAARKAKRLAENPHLVERGRQTPSVMRKPPGASTSDRVLMAMEPGRWYDAPAAMRLVGIDGADANKRGTGTMHWLMAKDRVERRQNGFWHVGYGGKPYDTRTRKVEYRLTAHGEARRAALWALEQLI
jgi:hypothetical protein